MNFSLKSFFGVFLPMPQQTRLSAENCHPRLGLRHSLLIFCIFLIFSQSDFAAANLSCSAIFSSELRQSSTLWGRLSQAWQSRSLRHLLVEKYGVDPIIAKRIEKLNKSYQLVNYKEDLKAFANHQYAALAYLGGGYEGNVFLIQFQGRLATLKEFQSREHYDGIKGLENQLFVIEKLRSEGVKTPKVLGYESHRLLLEYVEGIPVDQIIDGKTELLNSAEIAEQYLKTEQSWRSLKLEGFHPKPGNVIYNLKDKSFTVIDVF